MTGQWRPGRGSHVAPVIITITFQLGKISPEHGTSQRQLGVNKPPTLRYVYIYVMSILHPSFLCMYGYQSSINKNSILHLFQYFKDLLNTVLFVITLPVIT